jgi:hypothetical protein
LFDLPVSSLTAPHRRGFFYALRSGAGASHRALKSDIASSRVAA